MAYEVFIAEDEPPIAVLLADIVNEASGDFRATVIAHDGQSMLDVLSHRRADVLVTDIRMPVLDGLTLVRRARDQDPNLVCIVLTSYAEFEYARTALQIGAVDFILKTDLPESLEAGLERVLKILVARNPDHLEDAHDAAAVDARQGLALVVKHELDRLVAEPFDLKGLSEQCGYNPIYLSRIFKKALGLTPKKYHTQVKIARVVELLEKNPQLLLKEAATAVGFDDELYLAKVFKQETGLNYTAYRRTHFSSPSGGQT